MSTPLLSVVVPFYNTEAYFRECLVSLYRECRRDTRIEVILVDDGSTDGSAAIATEYARRLPERIRILTQKNLGQSQATNNGIKAAKGRYIGFADSDDWIDEGMYTTMLDAAIDSHADMVICDFRKHFPNGSSSVFRYIETGTKGLDPHKRPEVIFSIGFSPWNKLVRRDLFAQYNLFFPDNMIFQDLVVFVLMASKVHCIVNTGQAAYHYRIREGSLIHSWDDKVYDIFKALDILRTRLPVSSQDALIRLAIWELVFSSLTRYIGRADERFSTYHEAVVKYVQAYFPGWQTSRYLMTLPRWRRWYIRAVMRGWTWPVKLLSFLKRLMHR